MSLIIAPKGLGSPVGEHGWVLGLGARRARCGCWVSGSRACASQTPGNWCCSNGLSVAEPLAALSASPAHYTPHDLLKSPVTGNGKEMLA